MSEVEGSVARRIAEGFAAWQGGLSAAAAADLNAVLAGERPCCVLGRNVNAAAMVRHLPIAAVLDDAAAPGETWFGLPVLPVDAAPAGAAIVNAVLHRRPLQALERLAAVGRGTTSLSFSDFTRHDPGHFPPVPFVEESRASFFGRFAAFERIANCLADEISRRAFADVLLYRLTGDADFMQGYALRDEAQYFDVPVALPPRPVFVDGGAYRGETSDIFRRHHPDHGAIHVFEPNAASLAVAKTLLAAVPGIFFHPFALGETSAEQAFDASAANASRIAEAGGERVQVVPLDAIVDGRVDFVKFDLEGYETRALQGGRRVIETWQPVLAICVYHHADDFVDVPELVFDMRTNYRVRLRHYTEGWEETVMYFVPPAREIGIGAS
jgi:FkbM family methyltransferase